MTELPEDAGNSSKSILPKNIVQSKTDFCTYGYGGPCPPENDPPHPYIITVYALDVTDLGLDKNASPAMVSFNLEQHTLQKASLLFYSKFM